MHFPQQRPPRKSVFLAWNAKRNRLRATPLIGPHNMHDRQKALKTASPAAVRHALRVKHLTLCKPNAQQMPLADALLYSSLSHLIRANVKKLWRTGKNARGCTAAQKQQPQAATPGKACERRVRAKKKPRPNLAARAGRKGAATYSPALRGAVPSARAGLTSLFGMGRGGAPPQ